MRHLQFTYLVGLAFAASSSASSAADNLTGHFEITNFGAQHTPHSLTATVSFDVSSTSLPLTTTHCTNTTTGYGFGDLPYYCTSTCADNVTSFVFKYATANKAGGFRLHVQSGEARGSKWWPESAGMYFESPVGSGEMWEYLETGGSFGVGYH